MIAIVLNDGETWTNIEGCQIVRVRDDRIEDLEAYDNDLAALEALHHGSIEVVGRFTCDEQGFWKINYPEEG